MRIVVTAWILLGVLLVATLLESAITYTPAAQHMGNVRCGITALLAVVCGLGAVGLTIRRQRCPEGWIFHSQAVAIGAVCVVAIVMLVVLFGVVA